MVVVVGAVVVVVLSGRVVIVGAVVAVGAVVSKGDVVVGEASLALVDGGLPAPPGPESPDREPVRAAPSPAKGASSVSSCSPGSAPTAEGSPDLSEAGSMGRIPAVETAATNKTNDAIATRGQCRPVAAAAADGPFMTAESDATGAAAGTSSSRAAASALAISAPV